QLAEQFQDVDLVICDVAALGILVAEKLAIPSVLIENFTWDWIYAGYVDTHPPFESHIQYLEDVRSQATYHIQTEPICQSRNCSLTVSPVSRTPRTSKAEIRTELGVDMERPVILISIGGIKGEVPHADRLKLLDSHTFLIAGSSESPPSSDNLIFLPQDSPFFHPDLIGAVDAVVCKAGYSTIAECYNAGVPMGYILRERFRESKPFGEYIPSAMPSVQIKNHDWESGAWIKQISELLALPHLTRETANGADQIADFINNLSESHQQ
ncbi:hypothetical protein BVY04_01600, partial [bacterium M21]